jgi:threonine dehydrogenase-like Zn-dependent dehydrogenase
MPIDRYSDIPATPSQPATDLLPITPDDAADLAAVTLGLNVATPGAVRVTTKGGTTASVTLVPGVILPLRVTRVWATGTTATGIVGLI